MSETPARLELRTESRADAGAEVTIVHVAGEVDLASAPELAATLKAEATPHVRLVLDLTGVPFMDSSGLRELLVFSRELGDRLAVVVEPDSAVRHLLDIAEVAERINVQPSEAEALAAIEKGARGRG